MAIDDIALQLFACMKCCYHREAQKRNGKSCRCSQIGKKILVNTMFAWFTKPKQFNV